jgi:hypothetical protein
MRESCRKRGSGCFQSRPHAPRAAPNGNRLTGNQRIVGGSYGSGRVRLRCSLTAGGQIEYSQTTAFFRWNGFDEGDEISGEASVELGDDDTIEIELSFDNGDDASLIARHA